MSFITDLSKAKSELPPRKGLGRHIVEPQIVPPWAYAVVVKIINKAKKNKRVADIFFIFLKVSII